METSILIESIRNSNCVACAKPPRCDCHHVTTRKAGGKDIKNNLMPLCRECHVMWHKSGPGKMMKLYPGVRSWLEEMDRMDVVERCLR